MELSVLKFNQQTAHWPVCRVSFESSPAQNWKFSGPSRSRLESVANQSCPSFAIRDHQHTFEYNYPFRAPARLHIDMLSV